MRITEEQEDRIALAKIFIMQLRKAQDLYFTQLLADTGLTEIEDHLFDYVFNDFDGEFSEYIERFS